MFLALQEIQEQMKGVSFKDVVIRGKELSGALVTALINVYIKDNASVDAISNHMRDICPLLYSSDDSICSKVQIVLTKIEWVSFLTAFVYVYCSVSVMGFDCCFVTHTG